MRLTSPRFNNNARLQMAAENNPTIRKGDQGLHVRHIQQALIELGHPMPRSTARHGSPDGVFGGETRTGVVEFQRKQKKLDPGFGVDGVVGRQTMGALDRLIRTPKTLPPIPTGGGATDVDANLAQSLINVLSHPRLADISFSMMGVTISWGSYLQVRKALEDLAITAEFFPVPPSMGVHGVYLAQEVKDPATGDILFTANTFVMPFQRAVKTQQKVTVIHEATHAFCDIRQIGRAGTAAFSRSQSESVAFLAQAIFHRILAGGAQTDPLISDPSKGLNPVFLKADELARKVLAKDPLPSKTVAELHSLIQANQTSMGHNHAPVFDGI